jgi:hypothetical protein
VGGDEGLEPVEACLTFRERLYDQDFIGEAGRTWYLGKYRGEKEDGENSGWWKLKWGIDLVWDILSVRWW